METQVKAFFYEYKYYLYPEGCKGVEDIAAPGKGIFRRLKEEKCMAPDFIYESIAEEELTIEDKSRLFDTSVNLYTAEEYNRKLYELIQTQCKECERYNKGKDFEDEIQGHHHELSLDGTCYLRETKEENWSFAMCADFFWYKVSLRLNELATWIDAGKFKKLNDYLNGELKHFSFPLTFYGEKTESGYRLYISIRVFFTPAANNVIRFLAEVANRPHGDLVDKGWTVVAGVPKGVRSGKGYRENSRVAFLYEVSDNVYGVCIKHAAFRKKKRVKLIDKMNDYLTAALGDELVYNVVAGYEVVPPYAEEQAVTMTQLKRDLEDAYERRFSTVFGDDKPEFPAAVGYDGQEYLSEQGDNPTQFLPFKENIKGGGSVAPDVSLVSYAAVTGGQKPVWLSAFAYYYLYLPKIEDAATVQWYSHRANWSPNLSVTL